MCVIRISRQNPQQANHIVAGLCLPCALECFPIQQNTKKMVLGGSKMHTLKKYSKHGFGWAKNAYSKMVKMVLDGPKIHTQKILEKWSLAVRKGRLHI